MNENKIQFSVAEEEWIEKLQHMGASEIDATNYVIEYKRDMARYHGLRGNDELAEQLLKELGELE